MLDILLWILVVLLAGWAAFPLVYRLLPFLPDRGYALAKVAGLLLWGYAYWILVSLQILQNNVGAVLLALLLVAGISAWTWWQGDRGELWRWLREQRRLVVTTEVVFLLAFVLWALVRGTSPDISGTEKPMELAFINAILHSPTFPPHDPWLSGYAISYYYFGYVMVAMLARLTGIPGAIAFNLGLVTWFALTATAAYGLLVNLLGLRNSSEPRRVSEGALAGGLLAPLFLLIVSNLEGFLELLHAGGVGWRGAGESSPFWNWLGIQELVNPPSEPYQWLLSRAGGIWWWRASRVLQDFDYNYQPREIIDEFPFFSYYLGDLHPHVLAVPFVLLAVALALNLYLRTRQNESSDLNLWHWFRRPDTWLAVITFGGLSFLNTWDFPIYLALYGAAYLLARYQNEGWRWDLALDFILLMFSMGVAGVLLYLPFYLGFQSQAGGILPSLVFFTRGIHLWVMFGGLLLPILGWLVILWLKRDGRRAVLSGLLFGVGVVGGLWLLSSLLGLVITRAPGVSGIYGTEIGGTALVTEAFARRIAQPGAWLTLLALLCLVWALLVVSRRVTAAPESSEAEGDGQRSEAFVLLMVLLGTGLVVFPEFFYLRDQFGWRMNTIFKFYYQAWLLWSVAAGYAMVMLWQRIRGMWAWLPKAAMVALVLMGLVYPIYAIAGKLRGFDLATWTLDGSDFLARFSPDDLQGIEWLSQAPQGVVAEAIGGSYTSYARVSTFSGQPTVLGWPGHESQWRGGAKEIGSREPDIERLFRATQWPQAQEILERYDIRYVYVGPLERSKYRINEKMLAQHLAPIYQNSQVTIYAVSDDLSIDEQAKQP